MAPKAPAAGAFGAIENPVAPLFPGSTCPNAPKVPIQIPIGTTLTVGQLQWSVVK